MENKLTIKTVLKKIAKEYFLVETLKIRNMDILDFLGVSALATNAALGEAYKLGQQSTYLNIFKKE